MKIVYHGTTQSNMTEIFKYGFDISKIGSGWGTTYGEGIYFSSNFDTALLYSDNNTVIEASIKYIPYHLVRDYKATSKKDQKKLTILRNQAIKTGYTCFVTKNNDEIIIFDPKDIYLNNSK